MKLLDKIKELFSIGKGEEERKTGLALGGGGARGFAHLGVLEILEENEFPIDLITGTSMGAIIGASYAQHPKIGELIKKIEDYLERNRRDQDYIKRKMGKSDKGRFSKWTNSITRYYKLMRNNDQIHLIEPQILRRMINGLIEEGDIRETKKQFAAVAVDLISGENKLMEKGSLREAVLASASLPAVFPPVRTDDQVLVDGGVTCVVPVEQAFQLGADIVVAVDVSKSLKKETAPSRGIDILFRTTSIARNHLKKKHLDQASLNIRPDVEEFRWFEFNGYQEIREKGYQAAYEEVEETQLIDTEAIKVPG